MASSYYPRIITDGMVLCLDAGNTESYVSGSTSWFDLSNNSISGSLVSSPTYSFNNCGYLTLNGTSQFVTFTNNISRLPYGASPGTIEAWCYATSSPGAWAWAFTYGSAGNGNARGIGIGASSFITTGWGAAYDLTVSGTSLNRWLQLTQVYDGTTLYLYVNSVLQGTKVVTLNTLQSNAQIGKENSPGTNYWAGNISNVRVYNRALSATEISQNFNVSRGRFGI